VDGSVFLSAKGMPALFLNFLYRRISSAEASTSIDDFPSARYGGVAINVSNRALSAVIALAVSGAALPGEWNKEGRGSGPQR
jgi:hypothetical protein